ncbi:MAG TPA: molybdopterin-dependent oxidoreductase [Thermoleophilaceae bacterium]|nr:molybdopterin-dependent oxidoreductase [Thermoleophilaceae bacterium]
MSIEQKVTFCRICEPLCGMVATVEDGRVVKLRPDPDHPLSSGYACPKGIAMADIQNDPDRVTHPLRRTADGEFERVSWESALGDIASRVRRVPPASVGWYMGNPGAFSYSHTLWVKGFLDGLGSPHYYSAGSQDVNNRFAASALLYGTPLLVPFPDLRRTRLLLMLGANPLVSHGSLLSSPRIREQLLDVERVVVVDPRRTETARQFEHLPIRPDTDALLLLSMLAVIFDEELVDRVFVQRLGEGAGDLERMARAHPPEETDGRTGIPAARVRELARDFASAEGAAAYGRTGSCLGRFGTLVAFLLDVLNAVTGNLDRPGGAVFGRPPIPLDDIGEQVGLDTYGKLRSRIGGFPDVIGNLPASLLPREIETPGEGQIRALFVSAGNPVLSVPDGAALERALGRLELCVSLDLYVNETNRHAHYILPTTTFYEREDLPIALMGFFTTPFVQFTEAVADPPDDCRQEWAIVDDLSRRMGVAPYSAPPLRRLAKLGVRLRPEQVADLLLRTGPHGDRFGLRRGGLSLKKLRAHPHGMVLGEHVATGVLPERLRTPGRRVRLAPPEIRAEVERLGSANGDDPAFPLRLIGLRELRSHNSWMHNSPLLMRGGRVQALRIHPDDAAAYGLEDGSRARLESKDGALTVPVKVTDELTPGTVALPHGWGHRGGWQMANSHGGVNVNLLAGGSPEDLEPLAGMAFLNGIPVAVSPVAA